MAELGEQEMGWVAQILSRRARDRPGATSFSVAGMGFALRACEKRAPLRKLLAFGTADAYPGKNERNGPFG
jgi:hypothetical protein